jgi:hypothetical protein
VKRIPACHDVVTIFGKPTPLAIAALQRVALLGMVLDQQRDGMHKRLLDLFVLVCFQRA